MDQKKKGWNSYTWVISIWVGVIWLASAGVVLYRVCRDHADQERYFHIQGVTVDFNRQTEYTLGGYPAATNGADKPGKFSGNANADIWLPTQLIPTNIGTLTYNAEEDGVSLVLNQQVLPEDSRDDAKLTLEEKMLFPSVVTEEAPAKRVSGGYVSGEDLEKGIRIRYAEGKKEYMGLRLRKTGEAGVYHLLFSPRPDHLFTHLRQKEGKIRDTLELSYGSASGTVDESYHFDLYHFPYRFAEAGEPNKKPISRLVVFEDEQIWIDGQPLVSGMLPESTILISIKEKKDHAFLWWNILAINVLFLILYIVARLKTNTIRSYF